MNKKIIPLFLIATSMLLTGCGKKGGSSAQGSGSGSQTTESGEQAHDVSFDLSVETDFVSQDDNSQVYKKGEVTFTNNKAGSSTKVAKYNPVRCYKNSEIVVSVDSTSLKIKKLAFVTQNLGTATDKQFSFKGTEPLSAGTWNIIEVESGADGQSEVNGLNNDSVTITCSACQIRIKTMVVSLG